MRRARLCWIGSLLLTLSACDEQPPAPEQPAAVEVATPATPEAPAPTPPAPPPEAAPPVPAPAPVAFDALLAPKAIVRVVAVHRDHWSPCGVIHSTGVIEVEVLEVGEPKPHMLLIISCPVDFGHRELLKVGQLLEVDLFRKRQPWPTPPALRELAADLPRRWVKSMAELGDLPER